MQRIIRQGKKKKEMRVSQSSLQSLRPSANILRVLELRT